MPTICTSLSAEHLERVTRTGYTIRQDTREGEYMKTATIRARTEPSLKADAERVFRKLGISSSEAINLFYSQVRLRKGLPFPVEIPNAVTRETFEKTDRGEDLRDYPSLDDFFKKMGA
jgi:DNA-damage-inducible protein J